MRSSVVFASTFALLTLCQLARAQSPAPDDVTTVTVTRSEGFDGPEERDAVAHAKGEKPPKRIAIEINPFGLILGHYSAQLETMIASHSALTFNPHFDYSHGTTLDPTVGSPKLFFGFGSEVGYRWYSERERPAGFFFGPSLLGGVYRSNGAYSGNTFAAFGGAFDVGGQAIFGPGFVFGAGLGVQYCVSGIDYAKSPSFKSDLVAGSGWRPRALLSFGYAI